MATGTIMTRQRRSRKRRQRGRVAQCGPTRPLTVRSIVVWSLIAAIPAVLVDGWLCWYAMDHLRERGHIYVPHNGLVIAFMLTGFALTIPIAGVLFRRQARRSVHRE